MVAQRAGDVKRTLRTVRTAATVTKPAGLNFQTVVSVGAAAAGWASGWEDKAPCDQVLGSAR